MRELVFFQFTFIPRVNPLGYQICTGWSWVCVCGGGVGRSVKSWEGPGFCLLCEYIFTLDAFFNHEIMENEI